jgi:acid phosphatase family membrane protein YuiD
VNDFTDAYIKNIDGHAMPEVVVYTSTGALAAHLIAAPSSEELRGYIETALVEK